MGKRPQFNVNIPHPLMPEWDKHQCGLTNTIFGIAMFGAWLMLSEQDRQNLRDMARHVHQGKSDAQIDRVGEFLEWCRIREMRPLSPRGRHAKRKRKRDSGDLKSG